MSPSYAILGSILAPYCARMFLTKIILPEKKITQFLQNGGILIGSDICAVM